MTEEDKAIYKLLVTFSRIIYEIEKKEMISDEESAEQPAETLGDSKSMEV